MDAVNKPHKEQQSSRRAGWHFDVSTGLKRVLGSELITDDEVAIFELVKNSFDARAKKVYLYFDPERIVIVDNGYGMTRRDIKKKWLFVAYSSKRDMNRKHDRSSFRDEVLDRQQFAGSKGIGRFSTDRLGEHVVLQTRHKADARGRVQCVTVNWDLFDRDHTELFEDVNVGYRQLREFDLPVGIPRFKYGTAIEIRGLRKVWDRESMLDLKAALAKLINPFGAGADRFQISIIAPSEATGDEAAKKKAQAAGSDLLPSKIVNGEVSNFIFATLQEKTTFIEVSFDRNGKHIESKLVDRGELIYRIRENNPYNIIAPSKFRCHLYFLNQSAKSTFTRRVGLPSVQFGSVFLFRNGFRVFPIGEEGDDWFQIDRRKQQGYARYLGTRDIIGRIDVSGGDKEFQEASSRNEGLIDTPAVRELRDCFRDHCLRRLERYVVPVTWADKEDKHTEDLSRLLTDPGRARVTAAVASLVDSDDVELLEYSEKLIDLISERSDHFEASLGGLRAIAERTGDKKLLARIGEAEGRFVELKRSEAEARRLADEERAAKIAALARAEAAAATVEVIQGRLQEEQKRSLFLTSISTLDTDTILNMHHQITIYAADVQQQIENFMLRISGRNDIARVDVVSALDQLAFLNRKILAVSRFATKANFRLESEAIEGDLASYFVDYINQIAKEFLSGRTQVEASTDGKPFNRRFRPIDMSIVIDNLISNARKARASRISFDIKQPHRGALHILVSDDGRGLDPAISDPQRVFEKGYTMTDGSGLGLYHVRQVLGEMNGTIEVIKPDGRGLAFLIRIAA
jgi:signal transduction histidine kinase